MLNVRISDDDSQCRHIWNKYWPVAHIFDFWDVRYCFQESFRRPLRFLIAEDQGETVGLLALSWIEETQCFGHFPGETWHGKTWLEQNRILARNSRALRALIQEIPDNTYIRYLTRESLLLKDGSPEVDETGYLFNPKQYDFSFSSYLDSFSGKSRKNIMKEISRLEAWGVDYRYNHRPDIENMFRMNREAYGDNSFFNDSRFLSSFERLMTWLQDNGLLRITTVRLGGNVAAIDVGAVWNSTYTVLAGATNPEFPGVAKMINFHHMDWSCRNRIESVDFLCGDFGWKERFHLTPRPLYVLKMNKPIHEAGEDKAPLYAAL
jgi:hypothetical protein